MPTFEHDGFTIGYEERQGRNGSAGRPFVLLHGLLLPRKHQYALADVLADRGNRVLLLDLLGHGASEKPLDPRFYRMELLAEQVSALLDHLHIERAVIGGTSLGANIALEVAVHAAGRTQALFIEMPVLEGAAPAAGAIFLPLIIGHERLQSPVRALANATKHIPVTGLPRVGGYAEVLIEALSQDPAPANAVLRGLLTGEIAPHPALREKIEVPALIIGHRRDLLHTFSDAEELHRELRNSRLVQANSILELRFPPNRLSDVVADFLDEVWG
jgi:pimeloyl-ACP methyl ester carboxylesterase